MDPAADDLDLPLLFAESPGAMRQLETLPALSLPWRGRVTATVWQAYGQPTGNLCNGRLAWQVSIAWQDLPNCLGSSRVDTSR
jgi:hypothetical protein